MIFYKSFVTLTDVTLFSWPASVRKSTHSSPVFSPYNTLLDPQTLHLWSYEVVNINLETGLSSNLIPDTSFECAGTVQMLCFFLKSQILTVLSSPPEARCHPVGMNSSEMSWLP